MFEGVFKHAGKIRDYNITKKEWVLKGDPVMYTSYDGIRDTLDYDFSQEKNFSYEGLSIDESVRHIDFQNESEIQSATEIDSKCQNGTLELSLEELAIINVLKNNPTATQKQIAEMTSKSERTIKRRTVEMQNKGLICRENGKRNGKWKVLVEI